MAGEQRQTDWRDARTDPDSETDLGYRIDDWEEMTARSAGREQLLYLPGDPDELREEAFLVVAPEAVRDLFEMR